MNASTSSGKTTWVWVGVSALVAVLVAALISEQSKSERWNAFFEQCVERTRKSVTLLYGGKRIDWTSSPFSVDLTQICRAKADLSEGDLPMLGAVVTEDEYRLWLFADHLDERLRFKNDLRQFHQGSG